jgi:long-subunit acyl-CoA synthetase (AMP-forming)/predicted GNAT family acetyltransferase
VANATARAIALLTEAKYHFDTETEDTGSRVLWFEFLDITRKKQFLMALRDYSLRQDWTNLVCMVLQRYQYSLLDLIEQRVAEHPNKTLFTDNVATNPVEWSYDQIYRHLREIAGYFYQLHPEGPRVAVYTENCLEGACTDLACLAFDIFISPISPHFKQDVLKEIIKSLKINIVLADTEERLNLLNAVAESMDFPVKIIALAPVSGRLAGIPYLTETCKTISPVNIQDLLMQRNRRKTSVVATTMFTSGSTGLPKGVSFSIYNIVSKRFARAAAVPMADEEVFLCYLPLFHTFGRYLEMTGSIFWSGTYIFAGNTSTDTLLSLFPKVNPTGFISVPLRWQELYDRCQEEAGGIDSRELRIAAIRKVVGENLHWGLSAAGYLDPAVFRYFNQHGIYLNSGFGMTEATGGITMTPPGGYRDGTVGIPLPGISTRLNDSSELELSGHYIGRYLEDAGPGQEIPYPGAYEQDYWMKTGDVFQVSSDGYYEIVDRVKDIYKNNRGQTVAPQTVEKKFNQVPGIKRVFVVGDNRPYNVLLIVPDTSDPVFVSMEKENLNEYFHQIVMAANSDVAPYERVINFALIDRDFLSEKGELTPKGSYNRKVIEQNFRELIESLYQSNVVIIKARDFPIVVPKWFYRDLGILETDLHYHGNKLVNKVSGDSLTIRRLSQGYYEIGNLRYLISSDTIDLGVLIRQPKIWMGNVNLVDFCPVKEGWDVPMGSIDMRVWVSGFGISFKSRQAKRRIKNQQLEIIHDLIFNAYSGSREESLMALEALSGYFSDADPRLALALRYRIEALAYHPEEEVRCMAYRIILLHAANPEDIHSIPAFIESGLSFLNEASIRKIASGNFGKHRLDALKQRLYWYRTNLNWPAGVKQRKAFADVLGLLYQFARLHIEFYIPVRAELSRWILHKSDPYLSRMATDYFNELAAYFEHTIERQVQKHPLKIWREKLVFEHGISETDQQRLTRIFRTTTFLEESIFLTFNEWDFRLDDVPVNGIWVLRLLAFKDFQHYRLSINTNSGKHFDLHLVLSTGERFSWRPATFYWLASLAGFPYGPAVAPMLGSSRPDLGVMTTQYIGGLTAWDKIRELSEIHRSSGFVKANAWKKIFIRSFAVILKAWEHSGHQIVPCVISPVNIVVPEMDFRDSAVILSLAGWSVYTNTLSLAEPMVNDFYGRIASVYPWCRKQLKITWIFDACYEALGEEKAKQFLNRLAEELTKKEIRCYDDSVLLHHLSAYLEMTETVKPLPLSLYNAIDHYQEWYRMNPLTTSGAREQTLMELLELYKLQHLPEFCRYFFYRYTYYAESEKKTQDAFDELLTKMQLMRSGLAIQLTELSELQASLANDDERAVFNRMVFPRLGVGQVIDIMTIEHAKRDMVIVKFTFTDRSGHQYTLREPVEPRETGQLYQLFFREKYPKEISDHDHQYILTDEQERIVGGLTYRYIEDHNILLDGIVVTSALQGKGIASGMIEKFFASMAARGVDVVRAHFLFGNYYMKHFFEVDKKWGALIKKLNE